LYTDKDIPVILGLGDVHESIATESTSASEIAFIQSEESQSTIPNLFICQEEKYILQIYYISAGGISI